MYKDEDYIKVIAWLLGAGGVLLAFIGGLVAFIFKEHVADNHVQFSRNNDDHREIYSLIREKKDK